MLDRFEQVLVEPFVSHRSVEAFDVGILLWLAGLDKPQVDTALHRPGAELGTDIFGPTIGLDDFRLASLTPSPLLGQPPLEKFGLLMFSDKLLWCSVVQ